MRADVREVLRVILFMVGVIVVVAILALVATKAIGAEDPPASTDKSVEEEQWDQYDKATKGSGAGEDIPSPDDLVLPEPWTEGCTGYCPSIVNGVIAGSKWCLNPKSKCHTSHRNRSWDIWTEDGVWIEESCGGQPGILIAGTVRTESEGKTFNQTTSSTGECGKASIDLAHAQALNVNACDPHANLYAAGHFRNKRLIKLRERFPDLTMAPLEDQWKLAGAAGAIGTNKVVKLIEWSGALRVKPDGTLKYSHPYERVKRWMKWAHGRWVKAQKVYQEDPWALAADPALEKFLHLYSPGSQWSSVFGKRGGKVAFRFARVGAQIDLLRDLYLGGMPWGEPVIPTRPAGLLGFPGKGKHCACGLWPELEDAKPSKADHQAMVASMNGTVPVDPRTLKP